MNPKYAFQYCQKLVIFSEDRKSIFLARRKNEAYYDGLYAFIGGKMEITDKDIIDGLRREKNEEVGKEMRLKVYPGATHNVLYYKRKDNFTMVLPHYIAVYIGGDIRLNKKEYSDYKWVPIKELHKLESKIDNIPDVVDWATGLLRRLPEKDFIEF